MTAVLPPFEPISGRFIRIEPLTRAHLPELYEALAHPEVFAGGFGGGPAGFRADREGFLAWAETGYRFDSELAQPYGIRLVGGEHDGLLVGSSTLADFDLPLESTHIGWTAYDPRVWGTAVNPEAKLLLLGRAFDSGFGRVKIQADALNDRSRSGHPQARRAVRGHRAPGAPACRRQLARHGGLLDPHRRVAGGSRRPARPPRRVRATIR